MGTTDDKSIPDYKKFAENPKMFASDKQKVHIACIMISHNMLETLQKCLPCAQFSKEQAIEVIQHLGYVSQQIVVMRA